MSSLASQQRYSVGEYLQREENSLDKHEYRNGEVLLMAGGTGDHSLIVMNVGGNLWNRLRGSQCRAYDSNLRVRVPRTVLYTYPDVTVICGPRVADPNDASGKTFINPRLIVEVLSPSTEGFDRGEKFDNYREIESFREYVLVSQVSPRVETFYRQGDGTWLFTPVSGLEASVKLRSIEVELPMAEIYAGVEWPAAAES